MVVTSATRYAALFTVLTLTAWLLSGCLYQSEIQRQANNPAAVREEIYRVQGAVDAFQKDRAVLPIKNSDMTTPIYQKYVVDLRKLVQLQYLSSIPKNAYESGGSYYYVLIDAETDPQVKLMDLVAFQTAADVERSAAEYASKNGGKLPLGTKVAEGFYAVDFKALKQEPKQIRSMYSNQYLPLLLHESGKVGIDYGLDIMGAIQRGGEASPKAGTDLRELLVQDSFFVPVRSFPYVWQDEQPVPVIGGEQIVP
ncbi:hypothetical protein [Paenibacillus thermotolerans]|uniref:hypothetical protein n=1 Tax=Paenibacillus thermotolerans TaxID=3027807 RepID=UPI0023675376|nr:MULTISPECIES: hypothetical protein [unclassified Paenibacillus]